MSDVNFLALCLLRRNKIWIENTLYLYSGVLFLYWQCETRECWTSKNEWAKGFRNCQIEKESKCIGFQIVEVCKIEAVYTLSWSMVCLTVKYIVSNITTIIVDIFCNKNLWAILHRRQNMKCNEKSISDKVQRLAK